MTTSSPTVVLLTHSGDYFTIDRVQAAVARRGGSPFRLDTDRFPTDLQLTTRFGPDGASLRVRANGDEISLDGVRSVWMRRVWSAPRPEGIPDLQAVHCVRESRAALDGFLSALYHASWFDPLLRVREAENKHLQLRLAHDAGLCVPRTIVGNDPEEVHRLWDACHGQLITKMLTPITQSMGAPTAAIYTNTLAAEDLEDLDGLALSPMIFQEKIDKVCELRVVYVAGRYFIGALDAANDDWRAGKTAAWKHDELPPDVAAALDALMRALGLRFGAADILRARDGTHYFLEVNPVGEWGMLERDLELPIADAIAEELCKRS